MGDRKWKEYAIETEYQGITLKGRVSYWSKDYKVYLDEPVAGVGEGRHLMLAIPVIYSAPQEAPRANIKSINLTKQACEGLIALYEKYKEIPMEDYEAAVTAPHTSVIEEIMQPLKEFSYSEKKRALKHRLKDGGISNHTHQDEISKLMKQRDEICSQIREGIENLIKLTTINFDDRNFEVLFKQLEIN